MVHNKYFPNNHEEDTSMKAQDFDIEEYQSLVEQFGRCRRNVNHHEIYESLMRVKPNGEIPFGLKEHLNKYCTTNPSGPWGSCIYPAKKIRNILFNTT